MLFEDSMLVGVPEITKEQEDEGSVIAWNMHIAGQKALLDKKAREMAATSRIEGIKKNKVGTLIAEFDLEEWLWLKVQYGEECVKDRQFLHDYKKHRDQSHLPDISPSWL